MWQFALNFFIKILPNLRLNYVSLDKIIQKTKSNRFGLVLRKILIKDLKVARALIFVWFF